MQEFLIQYGLIAIFLCATLENDVVFIMTGVAIHFAAVDPVFALLACLAGALVHDSIWFTIGHKRSASIKTSRVYRKVAPLIEPLAARFGPWELFLCRFIFGTRNPSLFFWGVQKLPVSKFLLIETAALSLWGAILASLGFFLSERASAVIGKVKSLERYLLLALIIGVIGVLAARYLTRHEIKKHLPPPA